MSPIRSARLDGIGAAVEHSAVEAEHALQPGQGDEHARRAKDPERQSLLPKCRPEARQRSRRPTISTAAAKRNGSTANCARAKAVNPARATKATPFRRRGSAIATEPASTEATNSG